MNPLDRLSSWPVPNAAAAVVGPDGVLATAGDVALRFRLASVTKPLAALATLIAVEEEAVSLDQPLPDPALAAELPGATLAHLLAHASGIAPDRRQRAAAPGTRRIYSNAGYDLIGEIVAGATDIAFADYLAAAVFRPLGMSTASLEGSPASHGWGSVTDLAALLSELLNPTGLLHPSTVRAATTVAFPGLRGVLPGYGSQDPNDWGLGFELRGGKNPHWTSPRNSAATFGHFGRSGTMIWIDPQAGLGLVALADRDFDDWAAQAWPVLSDAVLDAFG
ncbi:serine hydrolase domain-containing protein [Jatrophihabitans lederbergiae]|uniref:Serine hydrolase domain-containing protein n=1 Tax=Jatrophihabitans lederbergiae TaxID=3075547 RepID=A0ABU2J779_9ACTN|nr:serine hydrolase domain-containing protein [Jatrophihabitans sp. DSM 44399]MDT0260359.1 serine hydrolase domain-containing protein [Jatrophihabitans sp. DSM 44399]